MNQQITWEPSKQTIFGYQVEVNTTWEGFPFPKYRLTGKRGAVYTLNPYYHRPQSYFVVNSKMCVVALQGNYTFTDRDGELTTVN